MAATGTDLVTLCIFCLFCSFCWRLGCRAVPNLQALSERERRRGRRARNLDLTLLLLAYEHFLFRTDQPHSSTPPTPPFLLSFALLCLDFYLVPASQHTKPIKAAPEALGREQRDGFDASGAGLAMGTSRPKLLLPSKTEKGCSKIANPKINCFCS